MKSKQFYLSTLFSCGILSLSIPAEATVIARNTSLASPGGSRSYDISVPNLFGDTIPVGVQARTLSYGGGTTWESPLTPGGSPIRNSVASGGFDPIITITNSSGRIVSQVDDSSLLGNQADPATGRIFDAAADLKLLPGTYQLEITQYDNFGQGLRRIDGFKDVTGTVRDNSFTAQVNTISDFLSNSVTVDVTGGIIQATLEPKTSGLFANLNDLAAFGSFDHFNWLNIVRGKNILALAEPFAPNLGEADPKSGGNNPFIRKNDEFLWYWDEDPSFGSSYWKNTYRSGDTQALWVDSPNLASPGSIIEFETYLVGVRNGNNGIIFAETGDDFENLSFRWRYTQGMSGGSISRLFADLEVESNENGSIEFLGFLDPEDWTEEKIQSFQDMGITIAGLEGGSIVISEPETVPESSNTFPVLAFGAVAMMISSIKQKSQIKAKHELVSK